MSVTLDCRLTLPSFHRCRVRIELCHNITHYSCALLTVMCPSVVYSLSSSSGYPLSLPRLPPRTDFSCYRYVIDVDVDIQMTAESIFAVTAISVGL